MLQFSKEQARTKRFIVCVPGPAEKAEVDSDLENNVGGVDEQQADEQTIEYGVKFAATGPVDRDGCQVAEYSE